MKLNDGSQSKNGWISPFPADAAHASGALRIMGALILAAFLSLMIAINTGMSSTMFESPVPLAVHNTIFLCIIPFAAAIVAARSHQTTDLLAFLMIGCGQLFFRIVSLSAC
jgi:hypothetical protein